MENERYGKKNEEELNIIDITKNEIVLINSSEKIILNKKSRCKEFKLPYREKINSSFIESKAEKKLLKLLNSADRKMYKKHWKKSTLKKFFKKALKGTKKLRFF